MPLTLVPARARLLVSMSRFLLVVAVTVAARVFAQSTTPDEQWVQPPLPPEQPGATGQVSPPPAPPVDEGPAPQPAPPSFSGGAVAVPGSSAWPSVVVHPKFVDPPNRVSVFGAPALGQWNRGESLTLGFPLLSFRFNVGLLERLDVGVGFDSFYGAMNEPRLQVKYELGGSDTWRVAASVEGGVAFFSQRASREVRGPRWITGHRNANVAPGFVISYQAPHPRAARLFIDLRYLLTFDTEPFAKDPLNGVPPNFIVGHNALVRAGAELPLSTKTSFVFVLGLDVHGREDDARVMPMVGMGLVAGL